jgi:quinol monooxygenase YgiN
MKRGNVYVSVTGLRLKSRRHIFRFWWHAIRSMAQARSAAGNLKAETRTIRGIHHTLSVWIDEQAMRAYLVSGAHRDAMKAFRAIATGRTLGFTTNQPPDWEASIQRWESEAREV